MPSTGSRLQGGSPKWPQTQELFNGNRRGMVLAFVPFNHRAGWCAVLYTSAKSSRFQRSIIQNGLSIDPT